MGMLKIRGVQLEVTIGIGRFADYRYRLIKLATKIGIGRERN